MTTYKDTLLLDIEATANGIINRGDASVQLAETGLTFSANSLFPYVIDFGDTLSELMVSPASMSSISQGDFTAEIWIRPTDEGPMTVFTAGKSPDLYSLEIKPGKVTSGIAEPDLVIFNCPGNSLSWQLPPGRTLFGKWSQIVISRQEDVYVLYHNGFQVASENLTVANGIDNPFINMVLGTVQGVKNYTGLVGAIRVFAYVLNANEVFRQTLAYQHALNEDPDNQLTFDLLTQVGPYQARNYLYHYPVPSVNAASVPRIYQVQLSVQPDPGSKKVFTLIPHKHKKQSIFKLVFREGVLDESRLVLNDSNKDWDIKGPLNLPQHGGQYLEIAFVGKKQQEISATSPLVLDLGQLASKKGEPLSDFNSRAELSYHDLQQQDQQLFDGSSLRVIRVQGPDDIDYVPVGKKKEDDEGAGGGQVHSQNQYLKFSIPGSGHLFNGGEGNHIQAKGDPPLVAKITNISGQSLRLLGTGGVLNPTNGPYTRFFIGLDAGDHHFHLMTLADAAKVVFHKLTFKGKKLTTQPALPKVDTSNNPVGIEFMVDGPDLVLAAGESLEFDLYNIYTSDDVGEVELHFNYDNLAINASGIDWANILSDSSAFQGLILNGSLEAPLSKGHMVTAGKKVGIGTARPAGGLHVQSGNVQPTLNLIQTGLGMGSFSNKGHVAPPQETLSDGNLKFDLARPDTKELLEKIAQLRVTEYEYLKVFSQQAGNRHLGLIADEVAEIFPDAVNQRPLHMELEGVDQDHLQTIRYNDLLVASLGAIQALNQKVDALEAKNTDYFEKLSWWDLLKLAFAKLLSATKKTEKQNQDVRKQ